MDQSQIMQYVPVLLLGAQQIAHRGKVDAHADPAGGGLAHWIFAWGKKAE